jgi:hypothetical protein
VVEHSIGNGEVDSSILSGSTIYPFENQRLLDRALPVPPLSGRERKSNLPQSVGENTGTVFPRCSIGRYALRGPPDPEMRNRPAANGTAYRKELISTQNDSETPAEVQARLLRRRFALEYHFAATVAPLIWGLPR